MVKILESSAIRGWICITCDIYIYICVYVYALGDVSSFTAHSDMRRTAPLVKPRVTDDGIWRRQVLPLLLILLLILLPLRVQRKNTEVQKWHLAPPGPQVTSFTKKTQILQKRTNTDAEAGAGRATAANGSALSGMRTVGGRRIRCPQRRSKADVC